LIPPTGCTTPNWFTDPVTASDCFTATPESADSRATSSASEALSPSTPP
jgi:hypothetical protein